jgi:hypothetical protein
LNGCKRKSQREALAKIGPASLPRVFAALEAREIARLVQDAKMSPIAADSSDPTDRARPLAETIERAKDLFRAVGYEANRVKDFADAHTAGKPDR